MSNTNHPVISVQNVSKEYLIGDVNTSGTLRDVVAGVFSRKNKSKKNRFMALDDVSFDVYKGETLGIVGSNGAGKSTILKILSRIVEPSSGTVRISGRVASILEVGTGFHPELTGRENVFFNGSVLGMKREEIMQHFNEIVEFSEIGKFIDTPVKFYSSGMYVRLAFAIAAHLDPDILIIDEALAVGDVNFQQKCIEKMRLSAQSGKTVLFVSHSMNIVEEICDRAVYLKDGSVEMIGDTAKVVASYLGNTSLNLGASWTSEAFPDAKLPPEAEVAPIELSLVDSDGQIIDGTHPGEKQLNVRICFTVIKPSKDLSIGFSFYDGFNNRLYRSALTDIEGEMVLEKGTYEYLAAIPTQFLKSGSYIASFDADVYRKRWTFNPYHTSVRAKCYISNPSLRVWDLEREGIIKPGIIWNRIGS
ncbi:MAG: polysaccharide ABC transporter ATP-binding protein [bacterium]|nr:polysaccharide ABC transporter ATP-binding protein [bacterium]